MKNWLQELGSERHQRGLTGTILRGNIFCCYSISVRMKLAQYKQILNFLDEILCDGTTESLTVVQRHFPDVSYNTLISIYSQQVQFKAKRTHGRHTAAMEQYYAIFRARIRDPTYVPGTILIQMAKDVDFSPGLLARNILERHLCHESEEESPVPKSTISKMLREPYLIRDPVVSLEIQQCILFDSSYGPVVESIKHSIGVELETHLKRLLQEDHKLAFLGEEEMRKKGYDKTPDVKLQVPIAVDGRIVNWIESKASFGDRGSHENYMRDQFWSYVNRFGSGLVVYWFGFIEEIATSSEQGIIVADDFPKSFTKLKVES